MRKMVLLLPAFFFFLLPDEEIEARRLRNLLKVMSHDLNPGSLP
jgi:hypothetical protein